MNTTSNTRIANTISAAQIYRAAGQFKASLNAWEIWLFNGRWERGLSIALQPGAVTQVAIPEHPRMYSVVASDGSSRYLVDLDRGTCTCPDAAKGNHCKHRLAARFVEMAAAMEAPKPSVEQAMKELGF